MSSRINLSFVMVLALSPLCGSTWAVQTLDQYQWTVPAPLRQVNSGSAEEWSPFLSFDGLTLYFARISSEISYYGRIFQATRKQPFGPFTQVREIDGTLNLSRGLILFPWVSPDNLRMYYHNEFGGRFMLRVSKRASANNPWPEGTSIGELNALSGHLQAPKLTSDELIIFFSTYDIPGGKGGYDICKASRVDRNLPFSQPVNLSEINTSANEGAASISGDGLTLVFHSDRNGPSQLFRATRASLAEPFGNVEHLSFADTPGGQSMHPYLSDDGSTLYFVRQFGEDRTTRDICVSFRFTRPIVYYVDAANGSDFNNGFSPQVAFATIQKGIDSAENGDAVIVYSGTYRENISLKGKNISVTSTDPNKPAVVAATIIDGGREGSAVAFNGGEGPDCIFAGFTITNGHSDYGGGIFASNASPTVTDCVLTGNTADLGRAIYCSDSSDLSLENCTFNKNSAGFGGAMYCLLSRPIISDCTFSMNLGTWAGGAVFNDKSTPTFSNCIFSDNSTNGNGGAMLNDDSSSELSNCAFSGNSARAGGGIYCEPGSELITTGGKFAQNHADYGGGIYVAKGINAKLTNCSIVQNAAILGAGIYSADTVLALKQCVIAENTAQHGGAIFCDAQPDGRVVINNCTLTGNSAVLGRSIACDSFLGSSTVTVANSILYNGGNEILNNDNSKILITYSDIQSGWPGKGNINADPRYATLPEGLAARWNFDEMDGNIAHDSAGNNHGTIHGAQWTAGWLGGALSLDGLDDYVSVSANAVTSTEFTVSAWANHHALGGGRNNTNMIFSQRDDDATPASRSIIVLATERLRDSPYAFAGIQSSPGVLQELTYPKKDYDEWHHYAMTVNASDFILYIDGREVNRTSNNQMGDYVTSVDYVDIGRHRYFKRDNGFFNGIIDEVAVWNRALSPQELRGVYLAPSYYELLPDSPCIDAGDPQYLPEPGETDFSGKPRLVGEAIDMGAYETQSAIELTASRFEFDATIGFPNLAGDILVIRNSGAGALNWQVSYDCNWLQVNPASGSSAGMANSTWLRVNAAGLPAGKYSCKLTVSATGAINDPQIVQVELLVHKNCFPDAPEYARQYADFLAYAAHGADPSCWCASWSDGSHYQCDGDASGRIQAFTNYRVFTDDLALIIRNWKKKIDTADPCADIDHKAQLLQGYRVFTNDLAMLITNWKKRDNQLANNCPRPDGQ